ncbi:4-hydroxythreonine-4-phosphate dehydrogenase PdxA [Pseudanabaena sp. FACHB-1998]|uniref:4-hydroxythreonine-4-phosphate dehydrogenase PdxA n=1 Tax=Pseudanabaena sp. FACHB-1998 TaxID=2692858 RepID=UPI0016805929|nr:4-hydroxythreonine-4-phosphate dehydrogenase PdxA [Pseudanabaena sp. FACHB-1998]MBD2175476.1 4-hydroxythreonine-4-phosphate dehydrogenase PdxA [Pseudanabaena sp. FACHB-1998]
MEMNVLRTSHRQKQPRIALTIGDPAGIGMEIILKALNNPTLLDLDAIFTIFGDRQYLTQSYHLLKNQTDASMVDPDRLPEHIKIVDIAVDGVDSKDIVLGLGNRASGAASFAYLDTAIAQTLAGKFEAIVTAPIAKSAWKQAEHNYAGQTELLAERSQIKDFGMLFVGKSPYTDWIFKTLLATVHIPLSEVSQRLTPELIEQKLDLLSRSLLQDFGISNPRIALSGINPHSGEMGQLGREECDWLQPLIDRYRLKHPHVTITNPIPPDTMWINPAKAWRDRDRVHLGYDAYLAMYHDQGLIPVKLLAFDRAVNTTIGLPFVRTSPDHGTAFDIAGKGCADPASMVESIKLAIELAKIRKETVSTQSL